MLSQNGHYAGKSIEEHKHCLSRIGFVHVREMCRVFVKMSANNSTHAMQRNAALIVSDFAGYWMEVKQGYEAASKFRVMLDYAESQLDLDEFDTKNLIAIRLNMSPSEIPEIPNFNSFELDKLASELKSNLFEICSSVDLKLRKCFFCL